MSGLANTTCLGRTPYLEVLIYELSSRVSMLFTDLLRRAVRYRPPLIQAFSTESYSQVTGDCIHPMTYRVNPTWRGKELNVS